MHQNTINAIQQANEAIERAEKGKTHQELFVESILKSCKRPRQELIDYIYEFASLYGEYYHNKDADKILEKVGEKIELPEQFLSRVGIL